jgi:hypothetical protein
VADRGSSPRVLAVAAALADAPAELPTTPAAA